MNDITFKVKEIETAPDFGEFVIEPLEPGFGHTIGNALRRVMYSSIEGVAVTSVKVTDVKHKFSTHPGLKENIVDLLLNVKELNLKLADNKEKATVTLHVKGAKKVTAADLTVSDGVEVVDPTQYIGSLSGDKANLEMELTVERGYGFSLAEERKASELGVMTLDAVFTPVRRVNYVVAATRVGRRTDLDKVTLKIWTNGTVSPKDALMHAAQLLTSYFKQVYEPTESEVVSESSVVVTPEIPQSLLKMTIDELDLPTRIYNSLRNGEIETIEQLLATPHKELVSMRNMGGKSISVIEEKLGEKGISLTNK
jgi:DNA-directed RNA polymerase subunit alpha